jgi:hypothetical protein
MFLFIMFFQGPRTTVHSRTFVTRKELDTMSVFNMTVQGKPMMKCLRALSAMKIANIIMNRKNMAADIGLIDIIFIT